MILRISFDITETLSTKALAFYMIFLGNVDKNTQALVGLCRFDYALEIFNS